MKFLRKALLVCLAVLLLSVPVRAADSSITVHYVWEDTPLTGVSFQLYQADGQTDVQAAYAAIAEAGQAPVAESVTNELGFAVFSGLSDGTYLVMGQSHQVEDKVFEIDMSLITLPGVGIDGQKVDNVTVQPKFTMHQAGQPVNYRVIVLWDDSDSPDRPGTVPVTLYRNGQVHSVITIRAEDDWQYSWDEPDPTAVWAVLEDVPEGYTVSYDRDGNTFIIQNTLIPTGEQPDGPVDPSLPQTGQLWWPVPLLAILGMVLLLLGWFRRKELRDEG